MNRTPRSQSDLFANPVLIGAVTALVAIVALLLSYNANNGLPFVPTYKIGALVPDAAELTPGNEVRIGGKRVGVITGIDARTQDEGVPAAKLALKLEKTVEPLPVDTEVTVRPRSPLGLKYLELVPGHSRRGVPAGGSLALSRAQPIVELDEVVNVFDRETRRGLQGVLRELGGGLAGRGADVNQTIESLRPLLVHLEPVARNLSSPRTNLRGLIDGLQSTTAAVAPVAGPLGSLIDGAAVTLAAIASAGPELAQTIDEFVPTEIVATRSLRSLRPVLADAAGLVRDAAPGVALLPTASHRLALAVEAGTPVLGRAVGLADRLGATLDAADALFRDPATSGSVRKLTAVVTSLAPTLRFVNPFQTRCNYLGLWTRNASSAISEGDANGNWFRTLVVVQVPELLQVSKPAPQLHVNPTPHAGDNGECEAGNEPYLPGQRIGNPPGRQPGFTQQTSPATFAPGGPNR